MKKKESALFFSYLCAHILQIAFLLLCFAIFAVILYLYDLPADPVLYAALLCAAVGLLSFILSFSSIRLSNSPILFMFNYILKIEQKLKKFKIKVRKV